VESFKKYFKESSPQEWYIYIRAPWKAYDETVEPRRVVTTHLENGED
jgi:hypothetical protein